MQKLQQEKNQLWQEKITNQIAAMQNTGSLQLQIEELKLQKQNLELLIQSMNHQ
jgi:hypothetical protein